MGTNTPLTNSVIPEPLAGGPEIATARPLAGNYRDDDGQAIDDYFEAAFEGPEEYRGIVPTVAKIQSCGRLVTANVSMLTPANNTVGPFQSVLMLPADPNRKHVMLSCVQNNAAGAAVPFYFGGEYFSFNTFGVPNSIGNGSNNYTYATAAYGAITLDDYTGPVFMYPAGVSLTCQIQAMAVTS